MATVKNIALHAVSLPSGRVLAPGKTAAKVDLSEIRPELEAGSLVEVKSTKQQKTATPATGDTPAQKED